VTRLGPRRTEALRTDPDRLQIPARTRDEPRHQVIGRIGAGRGRRSSTSPARRPGRVVHRVNVDFPEETQPFVFQAGGESLSVQYLPAESNAGMFEGNSNWRGPI
jgi:hypothetical protein